VISRRKFLVGGAVAAGTVAVGGGVSGLAAAASENAKTSSGSGLATTVPFEGVHQSGILTPPQDHAIIAGFDAIAPSQSDLSDALAALSDRARKITVAHAALLGAPGGEGPTPDSGVLGPNPQPDALSITIGFGDSLFDSRYGLASQPRQLH